MISTYTSTFTVVDIRKAFEGFDADLRMIARRTDKWPAGYVDKIMHDIIKLSEAKYLANISIVLKDALEKPVQATKYTVNAAGNSITGERPGNNDWPNLPNTYLNVIVIYTQAWHDLTDQQRNAFSQSSGFQCSWSASSIDTNFPHLTRQAAQTYASNGYELKKENYK